MTNLPQSSIVAERTWPVRALSLLFLVQSAILMGLGLYYFLTGSPSEDLRHLFALNPDEILAAQQVQVIYNFALIPLAIVALVATIGFYQRWAITWLYAMLAQGLILATLLIEYLYSEPNYLLMVFSTFLVLYLNYANAQANLRTKSIEVEEQGLHD